MMTKQIHGNLSALSIQHAPPNPCSPLNIYRISFSLCVDIHDLTEAKHACKPFSAAVKSHYGKEANS